eukprot:TRINITY_DN1139_c0_g2_i1.p1 TRINITY_DN1139_c0_g2~~TRINITY_DN1139_c0_g2_i1.p1  ORF type:complete len:388 (-),score=60.33 TRINITY_DN1139_c0_g2_i1:7-1170(-)
MLLRDATLCIRTRCMSPCRRFLVSRLLSGVPNSVIGVTPVRRFVTTWKKVAFAMAYVCHAIDYTRIHDIPFAAGLRRRVVLEWAQLYNALIKPLPGGPEEFMANPAGADAFEYALISYAYTMHHVYYQSIDSINFHISILLCSMMVFDQDDKKLLDKVLGCATVKERDAYLQTKLPLLSAVRIGENQFTQVEPMNLFCIGVLRHYSKSMKHAMDNMRPKIMEWWETAQATDVKRGFDIKIREALHTMAMQLKNAFVKEKRKIGARVQEPGLTSLATAKPSLAAAVTALKTAPVKTDELKATTVATTTTTAAAATPKTNRTKRAADSVASTTTTTAAAAAASVAGSQKKQKPATGRVFICAAALTAAAGAASKPGSAKPYHVSLSVEQ